MAAIDLFDQNPTPGNQPNPNPVGPGGSSYTGDPSATTAPTDASGNPRDALWSSLQGGAQSALGDYAKSLGWNNYDNADLTDVERAVRNLGGGGYDAGLAAAKQKIASRFAYGGAGPGDNSGGGGAPNPNDPRTAISTGQSGGGYNGSAIPGYPSQFSDPNTNQLEQFLQQQFARLQQPTAAETAAQTYFDKLNAPNPQMDQLMTYLNKQFADLSANPSGYTPDELAMLRTQAQQPIMAQRDASQQQLLNQAGARGILPSSGLVQSEIADNNRFYGGQSDAAQRDLAINALNRAQSNRQQALQLGETALQIPQQQSQQGLQVAQLLNSLQQGRTSNALAMSQDLYQLPRTALQDALSVVNGSNPTAAISPFVQLQGQQLQNAQYQQGLAQQQQTAYGQMLAQWIQALFPNG